MMYDLNVIETLPGLFLAKSLDSTFLHMTCSLARLVGWKTTEESVGKTDYDVPCKAAEFAAKYVDLDKQTIESQKSLLTIEVQSFSEGWKANFVKRGMLFDKNNLAFGIFTQLIDITDTNLYKSCMILNSLNKKFVSMKASIYVISDNNNQISSMLTQRQEECLFFLIRGKTAKQIANILNLSPRTIEDHIEKIRHKLDCYSKYQLIEKAINSDFLYHIPKTLFNKNLEKLLF